MKRFFISFTLIAALVGCTGTTSEEAMRMPAEQYLKIVASNPLGKTETLRVSRSLSAVEKSFNKAASSCLRQQHSSIDASGGMGHVTVQHNPKVYRDGSGVVLEIQQYHNNSGARLFLAKAKATSSGTVVTMAGPKLAHNVIFKHVRGYAQGRGGCFKYPSQTGLLGM